MGNCHPEKPMLTEAKPSNFRKFFKYRVVPRILSYEEIELLIEPVYGENDKEEESFNEHDQDEAGKDDYGF